MAISYGFFNSVDGDRKYNADEMSTYFEGLVSDGVYESVGDKLQVKALSGMQVGVQSGRALINCKWIKNDAVLNMNINAAHVTLNRYTAIVIQLNKTNRDISIITKDGENATNAVKPAMTDSTTIKELCLAYIYVKAGATVISQSDVTDMRGSELCPWVTGLVKQVDTSELFLQYQTAYEEQLNGVEDWKQEQQAAFETWRQAQQTAFETWLASLTGPLKMDITEYRNVVYTTEETTELTIGISEYNPNSDILYANINGVMFVEGSDFIVSGTGSSAKIILTNSIKADNTVEFRVLKSTVGGNGVQNGPSVKIGEVTLLAEKWSGEGSLFSQVVSIDGVTENSQVDLTPSVEQLVIFYEKDLTFVTENNEGIVTVYCIGQKPENDYTMQVTITEVAYE